MFRKAKDLIDLIFIAALIASVGSCALTPIHKAENICKIERARK